MALQELTYTFEAANPQPFPVEWMHSGVVGSGDMEVMFTKEDLGGKVNFKIVTPVTGFDEVWSRVLQKFVNESGISDVNVEINDNNATPVVVSMRLRQALQDAKKEA